jgi:hypothetical protein
VLDLVIGFIGYSQVVNTINYNTLKITITHKIKSSTSACLIVAWSLEFSRPGCLNLRTEPTSCGPNIEHPVGELIPLFSVATKRVTISGQRVDLYNRIRCSGNVFQLAVV